MSSLRLLACLVLGSLAGFAATPLVTVGPVSAVPTLDGTLNDAAWKQAVVFSNFVRLDTGGVEPETTEARILRSGDALYVGIRCYESALEPRQQRSHEFRSNTDPDVRDGRVWQDDSIELFLLTSTSDSPSYQFIVNARGASYEGRDKDKTWNGEWQATARTDTDGFYEVELSIPFATLGRAPRPGDTWRFQIGRNRKPADAYHSAWPPAPQGFHSPQSYGRLHFGSSAVPQIELQGFADHIGVGHAVIQADGLGGGSARVVVTDREGRQVTTVVKELGPNGVAFGSLRSVLSERVDHAGTYLVSLELTGPGQRDPLLITPALPWSLGALPGELQVREAEGISWSVAVNGQIQDTHNSGLSFRPGMNTVAVRCERGQEADRGIRLELFVNGRALDPAGWKASPAAEEWAAADLDIADWALAASVGGGIWHGQAETVVLARRVMVPTDSMCTPDHDPTHLARGAAQMLVFSFDGIADRDGLFFDIELPQAIRLLDPVDPEAMPWLSAIDHQKTPMPDGGVRHRLDLSDRNRKVDGFGGELSWCAEEDGSNGLFYQRVLRFGGSGTWQRVEARVTAPPQASAVLAWFLKWPQPGLQGVIEFDDLSLVEAATGRELIPRGDMETQYAETWVTTAKRVRDEDGNHYVRLDAKPGDDSRQIAFRRSEPIPVTGGRDYIYSCRARWQGVTQPMTSKGPYPLVIRVNEDAEERPVVIRYGWSSEGGATTVLDREWRGLIGPPVQGRQSDNPRFINWPSWGYKFPLGRLASAAQLQAMADQWKQCGLDVTLPIPGRKAFTHRMKADFTMMDVLDWHNSGRHVPRTVARFLEHHPAARATGPSGAAVAARACPTYMLGADGQEVMDVALEEVRRQVSRSRYGIYCTDYEVSISEPATICFDQRCIEGFRRAAGLDQGVTLTAEIILGQYIEPWTDFHARKNADLLRRIRDAVKQAQPDADYMVYSGYQSGYTKRHYGVDWALLAPFIDIASAGYGRKPDWVDATVQALDSVPLVGGVLEYERSNHPHTLRTRVMRRLLDCRGGVMSYYGPEVDARWQRAVAEASVVAAEWGTLIREGKRADAVARPAGGVEDKDVCVIEEGTQRLIAVFNESGQPVNGRLDLVEPGGMPTVTAFPSGDRVPGQSIPLQIPPWDYRLFIMSQR